MCDITGEHAKPVGILTDRDIVVGVIALDLSHESLTVEDVLTLTLVTLDQDASVHIAVQLKETYSIRRIPVVDSEGSFVGIISSSDLLELIGQELACLSRLPARQKIKEQDLRA